MADIRNSFPIVFEGRGSHRTHSGRYKEFQKRWSWQGTFFGFIDKKVTEIEKAAQVYLTTFLTLLSYSIDEAEAEEADDKMREQQRKMKR